MTPAQADLLRRWGDQIGVDVGKEALARLDEFLALLEVWNRRIRLTGERDTELLLAKHVPDCLSAGPFLVGRSRVADVGSGAGFPGIVLASVLNAPSFNLIESRRKPVSFLREIVRRLALAHVTVIEGRWEEWATANPASLDVVTGRAIRLDIVLGQARAVLKPGGIVVGMQSQGPSPDDIGRLAAAHRLSLRETRSYVLPSGERRQLAVCSAT